MPQPVVPTREYKAWRKKYARLLRSARTLMDTPAQRNVIEAVAGTAYAAGFNDGRKNPNPEPVKLRPWKPLKKPAA